MPEPADPHTTLALADWRRRVNDLYAAVRVAAEPEAAWRMWRAERDDLLGFHAQSPLTQDQKRMFKGLTLFDYDPSFRGAVTLQMDFQCRRVTGGAGAAKAQDAGKNRCFVFVGDRSVSSETPRLAGSALWRGSARQPRL